MSVLLEAKTDSYLQGLVNQFPANSPIPELSQQAITDLATLTLPDKNDEDWRFTELSPLTSLTLSLANQATLTHDALEQFALPETEETRIVFVNGVYSSSLSNLSGLPQGVYVGNFLGADLAQKEEIVKYLKEGESKDVFSLLNTAGLGDIGIIRVSKNVVVSPPIQILYITVPTATATLTQPRNLIIVEQGGQVELCEHYGAIATDCSDLPQNQSYFNNVVTQIFLGENAHLKHYRIQRESGDGIQISNTTVVQGANSNYTLCEISLGAKLSRHNLGIYQKGEQTTTNLYGLGLVAQQQVTDIHSNVALAYPHGTVNQTHKCIIDDQGQAVFNGKIIVPQKAQITNAAQINRNLLLSPQGRVNTKPELQITADNVKCTHGATVSQLETDEVFYLRSRGLSELDARHLLLEAFAEEILQQLSITSLRHRLTQCVACRNY
ncbi:MAG: Fe-S cluster assembly protein SufD [Gloeocapsa sp. DLM2.Bin57]|nr:MAG: Fe-S cluster assembly protein SufD [Gloeocapsa sp. DLM2.Bin57]